MSENPWSHGVSGPFEGLSNQNNAKIVKFTDMDSEILGSTTVKIVLGVIYIQAGKGAKEAAGEFTGGPQHSCSFINFKKFG